MQHRDKDREAPAAMRRVPGSFPLNAAARATWAPERTVLVVVHHTMAGTRLADVVPLIECDPRVQVLYTCPPSSEFAASGREFVRGLGAATVPWEEVRTHEYDLAVTANLGSLADIAAPVLLLSHGAGPSKRVPMSGGCGASVPRPVGGTMESALTAYGRVVPSVIGVGHEDHRRLLEKTAPAASEVVRIVGDPCYDRIAASTGLRDRYRAALGVDGGEPLVVVSSTYGPASLLGRAHGLPERLAREAADAGARTVMITHPGASAWHGRRQVRSWLDGARRAGMHLLPPEEGWRAALIAADAVVTDHGSVGYYAAALGKPVMTAASDPEEFLAGTHTDLLARTAPRLALDAPLLPQIMSVSGRHVPETARWYRTFLTSAPGDAASRLRTVMYELADLAEPSEPAPTGLLPDPAAFGALGATEPSWAA